MSSSPKRLSLQILGGSHAPAEVPSKGRMVIGSDAERADLVLEGQGVDALHCAVGHLKDGGWALKDLGSDFGTFINGERVSSARLKAGDLILVGSRRLRAFDPLVGPAADVPETKPEAAPAKTSPPSVSEELPSVSGYRVERLLGRGATGEVYLALQENLSRKVALKMLSKRLEADAAFVERFQAEARAAAALGHPNIVTVHDVGEDQGRHYISMEFMVHGCLESRVTELGPVPWREVLGILSDAAAGLMFAEQRGIVHRDIKPANLMLTEHGVTKIADLGLASQVEQEEVQGERGKVFGTPHFLAPELIRGEAPDARTDLFSLGATAYRLLTGQTPFQGEQAREILKAVLTEEPPTPSEVMAGIPEPVSKLVMRLLEKDPQERTATAAELKTAVDALKAGEPAAAAEGKPGRGLRMGALVLVLIAAGVGAFTIFGGGADSDPESRSGGTANGNPANAASPDETGAPHASGGPDSATTAGAANDPEQDELAFELREREAKIKYLELGSLVLDDEQRLTRLREIALTFEGTDTATSASQEADELERAMGAAVAAASALESDRNSALEALRAAAGLGADLPRAGAAIERMRAVPVPSELERDVQFVEARRALLDQVLGEALAFGESSHAHADEFAANGNFEGMRQALTRFVQSVDLPEFEEGKKPARASELIALGDRAQERIDGLAELKQTYEDQALRADLTATATGLGGTQRLHGDLLRLDLSAGADRVRAVAEGLTRGDSRGALEQVATELDAAGTILSAFGKAHELGQWRRTTVYDPRDDRWDPIDAVGGDEHGLFLDRRGEVEHVPWAAWGGQTEELDKLLAKRLTREWTESELQAIEVLLRVAAVVELLEISADVFDADGRGRLGRRESEEILQNFAVAADWNFPADARAKSDREQQAAQIFVAACEAASENAYSKAIGYLERLLEEHPDSLLVLLRSDGSEWRIKAPETSPPADAPSDAPEQENATEEGGEAAPKVENPSDEGR